MSDVLKMSKGSKLKMVKADGSSISNFRVELEWKPQTFSTGKDFDLDATAVVLKDEAGFTFGKGIGYDYVLFYNSFFRTHDAGKTAVRVKDTDEPGNFPGKPALPGCALWHSGDAKKGDGSGPDEIIYANTEALPADASAIHILVSINDAHERGQNFGQVRDAIVRVFDNDTNAQLAEYILEDDAPTATSLLFVEFRKRGSSWTMSAVNQGFERGLDEFFQAYGFQTE